MGGKVSCTLGEVKNRADLIIYWGGNPAECHPRHFTKYTLTQKGKFIPNGRKDRTMILVDIRETMSAKAADIFLQIRPGKDFEVLTTLRALIKDQPVNPEIVAETGKPVAGGAQEQDVRQARPPRTRQVRLVPRRDDVVPRERGRRAAHAVRPGRPGKYAAD